MTTAEMAGKRVLVVEDEPLIAMMIVEILEQAGLIVAGPAYDEAQALALIAEGSIDVAILDVHLGRNVTSAPIADHLIELKVPFIFATGYGEQALRNSYRMQTAVGKPYQPQEVLGALVSALNGACEEFKKTLTDDI
jgi:CheY-like chemotaxis protein